MNPVTLILLAIGAIAVLGGILRAAPLTDYAAMQPDLTRRGVVEAFVEDVPLLRELRWIDLGLAMGYQYNREASLGGIGFRALNGSYADAAKTVGIVNQIFEGTAIMGGEVSVDRQMGKDPAYTAGKIAMKVKAAARFFLRQFFDGSQIVDGTSFDGLNRRITGDNLVYGGTDGGVLSLDVLSALIDRVPGEAGQKRLLMGSAMRRRLGAMIRASGATVIAMAEWEGELKPKAFDGVPILLIGEDETGAEVLPFDEDRGTSHVTGSIYPVRLGASTDGEYLQGIARRAREWGVFEVERRGDTATQDNTVVEGRVGLTAHHPRCACRYAGITDAAT